jgi:hypothetical protein
VGTFGSAPGLKADELAYGFGDLSAGEEGGMRTGSGSFTEISPFVRSFFGFPS